MLSQYNYVFIFSKNIPNASFNPISQSLMQKLG